MFIALKIKPLLDNGVRFKMCGPPKKPPGPPVSCKPPAPPSPCIAQPPKCVQGPIPFNPCCPRFHHGKDTFRKFRNLALFVLLPLIAILSVQILSHEAPHKTECRNYEYMRRRTKRFPWGDGNTSFFHNPHTNFMPDECEDLPPDCD